jgi:hypothetical protein
LRDEQRVDGAKLSTFTQWEGVCEMLQNEGKFFMIIHSMMEVHQPYACPELKYLNPEYYSRRSEEEKSVSRSYLDKRIEWYNRFYGKNAVRIWMSDHGDARLFDKKTNRTIEKDYYKDEKTHVIFGISGFGITKFVENRFFSYEGFKSLIEYLTGQNKKYDSMFVPYIVYENLDKYAASEVNRVLEVEETKRREIKGTWQQFIGVRDEKFKYIRFYDGEERFFVLPNEDKNEIDNPEYGEDVERLRDIVKTRKFADIYSEEFFVQSRRLYEKR